MSAASEAFVAAIKDKSALWGMGIGGTAVGIVAWVLGIVLKVPPEVAATMVGLGVGVTVAGVGLLATGFIRRKLDAEAQRERLRIEGKQAKERKALQAAKDEQEAQEQQAEHTRQVERARHHYRALSPEAQKVVAAALKNSVQDVPRDVCEELVPHWGRIINQAIRLGINRIEIYPTIIEAHQMEMRALLDMFDFKKE